MFFLQCDIDHHRIAQAKIAGNAARSRHFRWNSSGILMRLLHHSRPWGSSRSREFVCESQALVAKIRVRAGDSNRNVRQAPCHPTNLRAKIGSHTPLLLVDRRFVMQFSMHRRELEHRRDESKDTTRSMRALHFHGRKQSVGAGQVPVVPWMVELRL